MEKKQGSTTLAKKTSTELSKPKISGDKDVKAVIKKTAEIKLIVDNMEVLSTESQIEALSLAKQIKALKKTTEMRKEFYTLPFNEVLKYVRSQIKSLDEPLDLMLRSLKDKLNDYQDILKKKAEKEQEKFEKKTEKAIENNKPLPAQAPIHVEKKIKTDEGTLGFKKTWHFEIEDQSKIPAEYMIPDEVKIGKVVRAGIREIAGVKIFSKSDANIR